MRVTAIPVGLLLILPVLLLGAPPAEVCAQQGKSHDEMREANRAAALLLAERLKRDRPDDYARADFLHGRIIFEESRKLLCYCCR